MLWFRHDTDASLDPKVQMLLAEHGPAGLGVYWAMVELMVRDEGGVPDSALPVLAHQLYTDADTVRRVVLDMARLGLIQDSADGFFSMRAMAEVEGYRTKQSMGRLHAKKRWHPEQLTEDEKRLLEG